MFADMAKNGRPWKQAVNHSITDKSMIGSHRLILHALMSLDFMPHMQVYDDGNLDDLDR